MLRLMCLSLFALASAFHFGKIMRERNKLGNYNVQLIEYDALPLQRHSLCLPTPFIRQICLPTALQFFMPLQTLGTGNQRCLTVPIMKAYVVKVCPPRESLPRVENSSGTSKELIKEVESEEEKERLSDKANGEVGGGKAEREEYVVKEKSSVRAEESEMRDKSAETKNNIIRASSETEFSDENGFLEKRPSDDENVSITSNLV